jgi:hypothetical protein
MTAPGKMLRAGGRVRALSDYFSDWRPSPRLMAAPYNGLVLRATHSACRDQRGVRGRYAEAGKRPHGVTAAALSPYPVTRGKASKYGAFPLRSRRVLLQREGETTARSQRAAASDQGPLSVGAAHG